MKLTVSRQFLQFGLTGLVAATFGISDRASALTGFSGSYAPANFNLVTSVTSITTDNGQLKRDNSTSIRDAGDIDITELPTNSIGEIDLWSPYQALGTADWQIIINSADRVGSISFDWSFQSLDGLDGATSGQFFQPSVNTFQTLSTVTNPTPFSTVSNISVNLGNTFSFRSETLAGASSGQGILTIKNFDFKPVPFEFSPALGLVGLGALGLFNKFRRSSMNKK